MKNLARICILLLVLLLAIPAAYADVIAEPWPFEQDYDDANIESTSRYYIVNSENGRVYSKNDPGNLFNLMSFPNGTEVYIDAIWYKDDSEWGYISTYTEPGGSMVYDSTCGWVNLDGLTRIMDSHEFFGEYDSQIIPIDEVNIALEITNPYLWTYPGSGVSDSILLEYPLEYPEEIEFTYAYTDPDGRIWGYAPYFYQYGLADVWVCLSDPQNASIPDFARVSIDILPAKGGPVKSESLLLAIPIIAGLIALVAVVTAVLIIVVGRKNNKPAVANPTGGNT